MFNISSSFVDEIRKILSKKRKVKKNLIVDQIPLDSIKYHRQSLLLSYNDFNENNQKYIQKFIKEKSYKSIFPRRKSLIINKKSKSLTKIFNNNNNNNTTNIKPKNYTQNSMYINFKRNNFSTPKKTPFQISHIKNQLFRDFINNSQKRNLNNKIKLETSMKSFSINKFNEKKKVFGSSYNIKRNNSMNSDYFFKFKNKIFIRNNSSIKTNQKIRINNHINDLKYKEKKNINIDKSLTIYKQNSHFNKINLVKKNLFL
jgi:hypothetical protein